MSLHRMHITNMPTCKAAFGQENPCICSDCEITGYIARNVSSYYLARTRQFSRCSYYFIGDMPSYRMNRSEYNRRVGYNWGFIEYTAAEHIFHMQEVIMNQNTNKSTVRTWIIAKCFPSNGINSTFPRLSKSIQMPTNWTWHEAMHTAWINLLTNRRNICGHCLFSKRMVIVSRPLHSLSILSCHRKLNRCFDQRQQQRNHPLRLPALEHCPNVSERYQFVH